MTKRTWRKLTWFCWVLEPMDGFSGEELCANLQAWINEHEMDYDWVDADTGLSVLPAVVVYAPGTTHVGGMLVNLPGLYIERDGDELQLLGCTIPVPDRLREMMHDAINAVCVLDTP